MILLARSLSSAILENWRIFGIHLDIGDRIIKRIEDEKMYVVYLINDNFGFDGIVGVFSSVELAQKAAEEFDDGFSVPTIYETVVNTQREYL